MKNRIESLGLRLLDPLPGMEAHARMAPFPHRLKETPADDHHVASVLLLLMEEEGQLAFPLIQRNPGSANDPHKGQIALPGGRMEPADHNPAFTALRETQEEIGIPASEILIVGALSPLYIPVSKNLVHPFVGWFGGERRFLLQEGEVHDVFMCLAGELHGPDVITERIINTSYATDLAVPGFQIGERWVWGATGMILAEFAEIMRNL